MTTFIGIDKWVDTILGRLNGAQPAMVKVEVGNAVREFFKESTVWRQDILTDTKKDTPSYDVSDLVPNATVFYVHQAWFKERYLNPVENFPFGWKDTGDPHDYWSPEPGVIRLSPIPGKDEEDSLRLRVSLRPSGCQVPDWTESHFFGAIVNGALARIYLHPKRPYSSASLGQIHDSKFRRNIVSARSQSTRRFTPAEHAFRFPGGWRPQV